MDVRRYLRIVRRWVPLTVGAVLGAAVLAYLVLNAQPRIYEASATLKLGQALSGAPILLTQVSDRLLTEYAYRGTSLVTMEQVIDELDLGVSGEELRRRVSTNVEPSSTLLTITARGGTGKAAVAVADAVGQQLIATSRSAQSASTIQRALVEDIDALRKDITDTRAAIAELNAVTNPSAAQTAELSDLEDSLVELIATHGNVIDRLVSTGAHSLDFLAQASEPEAPIEPRPLLYTVLAAFTVLLIVASIASMVEYFDDTLRETEELEAATGLPALGSLVEYAADAKRGADNRLITVMNPRSAASEEYRRVRANLEIAAGEERLQALLVTGTEPGMGIAVAAANLAVTFAESGLRVVLVDGDLRDPMLHVLFRLPNELGLSTLLEHDQVAPERMGARTRIPNLAVITSGSVANNPARALGSTRLRALLSQLKARTDLVIVAGPVLPTISDSLVLAAEVRDTLLVVARGRTRRGVVQQAMDGLGIAQARVLGAVYFSQRRGASPKASRVAAPPEKGDQSPGRDTMERARPA